MRKVHDRRLAGVCAELKRFSLRISAQRVFIKIATRGLLLAIESLIRRFASKAERHPGHSCK